MKALDEQSTGDRFAFSISVCDNDATQSASTAVAEFGKRTTREIVYVCEPRQNIALARNRVLETAEGDFVAFIDDDEFPVTDWLENLFLACEKYEAAGVLGPVRPYFEEVPPSWITRGQFCERPEHRTGRIMRWAESRTGNVLLRRAILSSNREPFNPNFGTGGEDMDFFRRMAAEGHTFVWCNEAIVHEMVPASRLNYGYMLKRALLRGRNILKHPVEDRPSIGTSLVAIPLYLLLLPVTAFGGKHHFMKYCIKLCDHGGRLLAMIGLNPVAERDL